MASLWQRLFNIFIIIIALYFFYVTANYRVLWIVKQQVDAEQTELIIKLSDTINGTDAAIR
jgi:hypothetical protein